MGYEPEDLCAYIRNTGDYVVWNPNNGRLIRYPSKDKHEIPIAFHHHVSKEKMKEYIQKPGIIYEAYDFLPPPANPRRHDILNTFTGFWWQNDEETPDLSDDEKKEVHRILWKLVFHLTAGSEKGHVEAFGDGDPDSVDVTHQGYKIARYLWLWVGHLLSYPGEKPNVAIVMVGDKGVGKGQFVGFLQKLLQSGTRSYIVRNKNIQGIFKDAYSEERSGSLLIAQEETDGDQAQRSFKESLKDAIDSQQMRLNPKYARARTESVFDRFIIQANEYNPIDIRSNDRKFAMVEASTEIIPPPSVDAVENQEFFRMFNTKIIDDRRALKFLANVLARDYEDVREQGFRFTADKPMTSVMEEAAGSNIDDFIRFFLGFVADRREGTYIAYDRVASYKTSMIAKEYNYWRQERGFKATTKAQTVGTKLRILANSIDGVYYPYRTNAGVYYKICCDRAYDSLLSNYTGLRFDA